MKMTNWKLATLAMAATLFTFTSCSDNDEPNNGGGVDAGSTLTGELTKDLTLKSGNTYYLSGGYHVKSGTTLTIQPGVNIIAKDDDIVDYILIEQGAKIDAQGTASSPIIMTSEKKEAGAWGGLHICGYAHTNAGTGAKSEIGDAAYGGSVENDNSGTLRYIRLEYTGYAFSEEKEANGVSFYGVGNGTTVEYLQAYKGSDDGFEFFGGSVNVKYLVATDCSDDSFDWTEGWNGYGQFLVGYQGDKTTIGYDCDCLIEADNNGKNAAATPVSAPVLANMTLVGNSSTANKRGIRLRAGTQAKIYNTLVKGKTSCLTTETVETETALVNGTSVLDYVYLESGVGTSSNGYTEALFTGNTNNGISKIISLTGNYIGTIDGGKDMSTVNSFFTQTTYKGAVSSSNDWTTGWTLASNAVQQSETLEGSLTSGTKTLTANKVYYLTGGYTVKSGATLKIEAGVTVIAKNDNIVDYILIEQGGKIDAQGTASSPIVMTSEKKEAGAWGGIHICGYAHTNLGATSKSEIGDATYGGTNDADNSGTLRYIRLEYTGYAFSEEKEANGVSFYGVGNGTTVEYLQAYKGSDDGFEFFGGSVNVKYLVATSCSDDSFDWTEGWNGKGQFLVAYQQPSTTLGYECDCLIEADNLGSNAAATPISQPTLANLTLIGNGSTANTRGIRLRAGTYAKIYNALVTGKTNNLTTETKETEEALVGGTKSILNYIHVANDIKVSGLGGYTSALFAAATGNAINQTLTFTDTFFGTVDGGADLSADSFFTKATYKGAISTANNWTAGWIR